MGLGGPNEGRKEGERVGGREGRWEGVEKEKGEKNRSRQFLMPRSQTLNFEVAQFGRQRSFHTRFLFTGT